MNWTHAQIIQFRNWECDMMAWRVDGGLYAPPRKPANYDLWKQGPDPLKLASTQPICCPGGGLVPENWTPSAQPATEAPLNMTQPNLL